MGPIGVLIIISFVIIVAGLYITMLINKMKIMREDVTQVEDDFTEIIEKLVENKLENYKGVVENGKNKDE